LAVNGAVSLDSETEIRLFVDNPGNTPGSDYSQLTATGNASLGGGLTVSTGELVPCPNLAAGNVETLISASGTISGEFSNAPNGSTVSIFSDCAADKYSPVNATINYSAQAVTLTDSASRDDVDVRLGRASGLDRHLKHDHSHRTDGSRHASAGRITTFGLAATVPVSCKGSSSCQVEASLIGAITTGSHALGRASEASRKPKTVLLGRVSATVPAGKTVDVKVTLNATARSLLSRDGSLKATLIVEQLSPGRPKSLESQPVRFKRRRVAHRSAAHRSPA
jgi:hypothetical protein